MKSIRVAKFSDLPSVIDRPDVILLDVRQIQERRKSHLVNSLYIPFYEMEWRVEELPAEKEIWVHCESGYRAASVLKFIEDLGCSPILINDDFANALITPGLSIVYEIK